MTMSTRQPGNLVFEADVAGERYLAVAPGGFDGDRDCRDPQVLEGVLARLTSEIAGYAQASVASVHLTCRWNGEA